jgi:hypothetical protein
MDAGHSFASGLKGRPFQWSCLRARASEEAGGQLDSIRLIAVSGSLGSRLMPKEKAQKKDRNSSASTCVILEELFILQV